MKEFDKITTNRVVLGSLSSNKKINWSKNSFYQEIPIKIRRIIFIFLGTFLFLIICINHENIMPDKIASWVQDFMAGMGTGEGFPQDVAGSKIANANFMAWGKNLITVSDGSITVYNSTAKKLFDSPHSFTQPILKLGGQKALMYNLRGANFEIISKSKSIFKGRLEENILAGAISRQRIYGFATETKGYCSKMTIYNEHNEKLYKYYFLDNIVSAMAINHNGSMATTVCFSVEDGVIRSSIYVFDFKSETPKLKMEYPGILILDVDFLSNGNVAVVSDKLFSVVDVYSQSKRDYFYQNKQLKAYEINSDFGVALGMATHDETDCQVVLINQTGHVSKQINTEPNLVAVSYNGNVVAALTRGKLSTYSCYSGKNLSFKNISQDCRQLRLASSGESFVLDTWKIENIKHN